MKLSRLNIFLLLIILLISFFSISYLDFTKSKLNRLEILNEQFELEYNLENKYLEFKLFQKNIGLDLVFLNNLYSMRDLVDSSNFSIESKNKLANELKQYMLNKPDFYQISYIDELGLEQVKVENRDGVIEIISEDKLQNKFDTIYFQDSLKLTQGDFYLSEINLNIEYLELDTRTLLNETYFIPSIRYGIPLYDKNNVRQGILIINVFANPFLDIIRFEGLDFSQLTLIDNDGYYVANKNYLKEFGAQTKTYDNFFTDNPQISKDIFKNFNASYMTVGDNYFRFKYIYPTLKNFEIYNSSNKIYGEDSEKIYYLILVNKLNSNE